MGELNDDEEWQIVDAVKIGDIKFIQNLLWRGLSPDYKFSIALGRINNIFLQSVFHNKLEIVKLLIQDGANINYENSSDENALVISAIFNNGDHTIFNYLIDKGINVNSGVVSGMSLLSWSMFSNIKIMKKLLDNGVDVNRGYMFNHRPLHFGVTSICMTSPNVINKLIDNGADLNLCNSENQSPLHKACVHSEQYSGQMKRIEKIDIFLERGANPYIKTKNDKDIFNDSRVDPVTRNYIKKKISDLHHLNLSYKMLQVAKSLNTESPIDCLSDDILQLISQEITSTIYNYKDTLDRSKYRSRNCRMSRYID